MSIPDNISGPTGEYDRRLAARRGEVERLSQVDQRISVVRLAIAVSFLVVGWFAIREGLFSWLWVGAPIALFVGVALYHSRVVRTLRRRRRAVDYYVTGLDRIDGRWAGKGNRGERFRKEAHLYAADLDLFGEGSLFELICAARTSAGEERLAEWLCSSAGAKEVGSRQKGVDDLRARLDLREDLAILGEEVSAVIDPEEMARWGEQPPGLTSTPLRLFVLLLSVLTVGTISLWLANLVAGFVPMIVITLQVIVARRLGPAVERTLSGLDKSAHDLDLLSQVLERLEQEEFESPILTGLSEAPASAGHPPSQQIARLHRLVDLFDARRNQMFAPFAALLMWGTQVAFAVDAWRGRSGRAVRQWLSAVGDIEALGSLSRYAWESPGDPFPVFAEGPALFEAEGLGHPLLDRNQCVVNDVSLGKEAGVFIVSGSNMSGKSTLLRTIGVNTVLAHTGAPVRAKSLRLSPLVVGASIRIQDSLKAGTSRFYAEVKRLRGIVDLTDGTVPVLFLIDEMLHGTNSHDRRIGSEGVVKGLMQKGAIGLITTHDLALTEMAGPLGASAVNVHFEDHLEDGRMTFDYRLRPGVVRKSNALELMRAVGLQV